jgi:predicted enzyme related to lactoylglutathione lyase
MPEAPTIPPEAATLSITFFYYRDLSRAMAFYETVLGFPLVIDQGWSKIYRAAGTGHIGLVDESRGSHRAAETKPVQFCIRVPDLDAWHAWISTQAVDALSEPRTNDPIGIRAFVFNDPEGYQIEVQSALRPGA